MISLRNTLWNSVTGMQSSQAGLSTVGHNIANAGTEGYSRQRVVIGNRGPFRIFTGSEQLSQAGQGSRVDNIMRSHSKFLERQLLKDRLQRGFFDGRHESLRIFERLYDDGATSTIGNSIDGFFGAVRELSQDPSSFGARQVFMDSAQIIARDFNQLATDARAIQDDIDNTLRQRVERINHLASVIAEVNARVGVVEASGRLANDFRDQRERAVKEIAELGDVRVLVQQDGTYGVDFANGFSLVQGDVHASLSVLPDGANQGLLAIQHVSIGGVVTDITGSIREGEMGGLLDARDNIIPGHVADLDNLAANFVQEVNATHRAGFGLDAVNGRDLFTPVAGGPGAALAVQVDPAVVADLDQIAAATDPLAVPGDNRNLLAMADLQHSAFAALGNTTFNHFYGEMVRGVGNDVQQNDIMAQVHQVRFEQSDALRESIEGVSIDDEMVNLTQFQKHFEASARVMTTVVRLMDEVMQLIR